MDEQREYHTQRGSAPTHTRSGTGYLSGRPFLPFNQYIQARRIEIGIAGGVNGLQTDSAAGFHCFFTQVGSYQ